MRSVIYFALSFIFVTSHALQCYNKQDAKMRTADAWVTGKQDSGTCSDGSWCAEIKIDGTMAQPGSGGMEVKGTFYKCVSSQKCDDIGNGCIKTGNFDIFNGDIDVCCCKTDLCNSAPSVFASIAVMIFAFVIFAF